MSLLHVARFPRDPLDRGREAEDESQVKEGELISRGKTHWLCPAVRGDTDQKIQLFYTLFFLHLKVSWVRELSISSSGKKGGGERSFVSSSDLLSVLNDKLK